MVVLRLYRYKEYGGGGKILCLGALCALGGGLSVSRQPVIWTAVVCSSHRTQKVRSCFPGAHSLEETRAPAVRQCRVRVLGRGRGPQEDPWGAVYGSEASAGGVGGMRKRQALVG